MSVFDRMEARRAHTAAVCCVVEYSTRFALRLTPGGLLQSFVFVFIFPSNWLSGSSMIWFRRGWMAP